MKSLIKYILLILTTIAVCWFVFQKCHPGTTLVKINSDSLKVTKLTQELEVAQAKLVTKAHDSIVYVTRIEYRKAKALTGPCDSILPIIIESCDSLAYHDSVAIAGRDTLESKYKKLIRTHENIHSVDSARLVQSHKTTQDTVKYFRRQVRRQKAQKWVILGLWGVRESATLLR